MIYSLIRSRRVERSLAEGGDISPGSRHNLAFSIAGGVLGLLTLTVLLVPTRSAVASRSSPRAVAAALFLRTFPNDATKPDMAGRGIDLLALARSRSIPKAIVRCAQM
jgi:hypothetical protein